MTTVAEQIARDYFAYSNESDMSNISALFRADCTYYSSALGFFIGRADVIEMQSQFHGRYESLKWQIKTLEEIKPGVIEIHFSFDGVLQDGEAQQRHGREHILIHENQIQHIAVGL